MRRLVVILVLLLGGSTAWGLPARVLLLPFESVGPGNHAWVARALGQNLLADLSRITTVQPILGNLVAGDPAAALKAGEDAGARFVVYGSYQVIDTDIRITGQVLDVGTGQPVTGLKATGSQRDLFGLEDAIGEQVRRAMLQADARPIIDRPGPMDRPAADVPAPIPPAPNPPAALPGARPPDPPQAPPVAEDPEVARAKKVEAQIDRAIAKLRAGAAGAPVDVVDAPLPPPVPIMPISYRIGGYPLCYPIYYGGYGLNSGYCNQSNLSITGSYHGNNWNFYYRIGSGTRSGCNTWGGALTDGRNYQVPTGNYAVFPGNYIKGPRMTMGPAPRR